eukprot:COSAG06_NODE_2793_length_6275_cov_2.145563_1_plen_144_part_00
MDSADNPTFDDEGAAEDASIPGDSDDGGGTAQTEEQNVLIKRWHGILARLLSTLFGDGDAPVFYTVQAVLVLNVLTRLMSNYTAMKYRDNAADPQRPFLSTMHMRVPAVPAGSSCMAGLLASPHWSTPVLPLQCESACCSRLN